MDVVCFWILCLSIAYLWAMNGVLNGPSTCLCTLGKFTRRGSTDTAGDMDSLGAKHSHSHHTLLRDMPDHSNSHSDNTVKEGKGAL